MGIRGKPGSLDSVRICLGYMGAVFVRGSIDKNGDRISQRHEDHDPAAYKNGQHYGKGAAGVGLYASFCHTFQRAQIIIFY